MSDRETTMTPDAALLEEVGGWITNTPSSQFTSPMGDMIYRLAQALRASLDRERELEREAEQEFVVTGQIVERAEQAERDRDALAAELKELREDRNAGDELLARIQGIVDGTGSTGSYSHHLDKLLAAELQRLKEGQP